MDWIYNAKSINTFYYLISFQVVKKHSEHKGPAPLPPSSVIKPNSNEEPQNSSLVLKIQDSKEEKEIELVIKPKEIELPKSKTDKFSEIGISINNSEVEEKQSLDIKNEKNATSNESIQLHKHETPNPRPISVVAGTNDQTVKTVDDSQLRTRRRSSSASNRNQRRPSPPSLDKVLQMNQNIEKNKGKMPTSVMNELTGRLQSNQDETEQIKDENNSK